MRNIDFSKCLLIFAPDIENLALPVSLIENETSLHCSLQPKLLTTLDVPCSSIVHQASNLVAEANHRKRLESVLHSFRASAMPFVRVPATLHHPGDSSFILYNEA